MTGNVYTQYMNTDEADGRFECKQNSAGELYVGYEEGYPFYIFSDRTEINPSWVHNNEATGLRLTGKITPGLHRLDKKYIPRDVFNKIHTLGNSVEEQNSDLLNKINAKMDRINPTGSGAFSLGRKDVTTVGRHSFAAGNSTTASGANSYALGSGATATGACSYAVGYNVNATGNYSFALGGDRDGRFETTASGAYSFALGATTNATGDYSFAAGHWAKASGANSFALGTSAEAFGDYSFAVGYDVTATKDYSFVVGCRNAIDDSNRYAFIVGNGNTDTKSNAYTLDWSGNGWFAGDVFVGGSSQDDGVKLLKTGEAIPIPSTASIGQVLVVKAVDANGKPTEWETVDAMVVNSSTPDSIKKFKISVDDSGTITATEIN